MPLDQTGILPGRRIRSAQISDLYDLLTGVMTDQPVTLASDLTVYGRLRTSNTVFQASDPATVPLIAQGTLGQTADIFQVKSYAGGTYFRVDAGGTIWSGTTTAVLTNPMTTAADMIVGGVSGAPTRLAKGDALQVLRMNAGTNAQEWATLANSSSQADLGTAVVMASSNTFYDGPAVSLTAGTWFITATMLASKDSVSNFTAKLWDGTTVISSTQGPLGVNGQFPVTLSGVVTPSGAATWKVSAARDSGSGTLLIAAAANSPGNNASHITAVKLSV